MRDLMVGLLLLVAVPQVAWADARAGQSALAGPTTGSELRALLNNLHISFISKAQAATECKEEGELCKSNADCCSSLECSGDPQATCRPQE